ncbi:zinc finger, CCHC-type containing protein [Tanacetum coccineum]
MERIFKNVNTNKDELSLVQLGSHFRKEETLRMEECRKGKGKDIARSSFVNMVEDDKNKKNNKNSKGNKRKFHEKKKIPTKSLRWHVGRCRKTGHSKDCRVKETTDRAGKTYVGRLLNRYRLQEGLRILRKAVDDEIGSIMENNTWVLSDLPPGCKPLGCKWIFKKKMKVDGTIDKFKARLVIQGFRQKEIRLFDTNALSRISTIRLLIALAATHNLVIHQMDVKTAFLNGDLEEEIYMKQPEGFVMPGKEHKVCKLIKSLYGLKQAPKQWHHKFDEVVLSNGFVLNQSDKCVYCKFDESGKGVIICLYVDDMLIFGTDQTQVDKTKEFLSSNFSMKDMGEADVILGIRIKRENKGLAITQSHYIEKILKKFNCEGCGPVSTPMEAGIKLVPHMGKPVNQLEYSRAIGCLMYAMTSTRPDIAYAVGKLSRFTSNPSNHHWEAIIRVFRYLKKTMNYGLSYVGFPSVIEGYSDASWNKPIVKILLLSGWLFLLDLVAVGNEEEWKFTIKDWNIVSSKVQDYKNYLCEHEVSSLQEARTWLSICS